MSIQTTEVRDLIVSIEVFEFISSRKYVSAVYHALKSHFHRYSYRKFSEDLGFGYTNYMHLICCGERSLTLKAADRIGHALNLDNAHKKYLCKLTQYETARKPIDKERHFSDLVGLAQIFLQKELSGEELEYFSEWYHPVIRECVGLIHFEATEEWFLDHLNTKMSYEKIRKSLILLEKIGYISFDMAANKYSQTMQTIRTPKEVAGLAVSRFHQNMITQGRDAVLGVVSERRDISAVTVCVNQKTADEIKVSIQRFRKEMLDYADRSSGGDHVYQLNIQWFPFTKGGTDDAS